MVLVVGSQASKAALISFYETMRVELAHSISITIITPGFIESEMTIQGKHLSRDGVVQEDREIADVSTLCASNTTTNIDWFPNKTLQKNMNMLGYIFQTTFHILFSKTEKFLIFISYSI